MIPRGLFLFGMIAVLSFSSCRDRGDDPRPVAEDISTDDQLFRLVTVTQPFRTYTLFPEVDSVARGSLNGSTAHQPLVRVSINATAHAALEHDSLPAGASFPDGSIIFKQIIAGGQTSLFAIMYKNRENPLSANGWLWAEFTPDGTPFISVTRRGINCTECHAREQGPRHDFVRTFERRHRNG